MKIITKIDGFIYGRKRGAAYRCWMCDAGHNNPAAFLWHINAHRLEMTGRPMVLPAEREDTQTAQMFVR